MLEPRPLGRPISRPRPLGRPTSRSCWWCRRTTAPPPAGVPRRAPWSRGRCPTTAGKHPPPPFPASSPRLARRPTGERSSPPLGQKRGQKLSGSRVPGLGSRVSGLSNTRNEATTTPV
eukprot:1195322-Prorocentrum_minimum.AAC.7